MVEVYLERRGGRSVAGSIYKGVVDNVLPGMEASFVDIGLERNGFLYVGEIVMPELEDGGNKRGRRIQDLISRGQEVLVQAVKDPMGSKGRAADDRDITAGALRRIRPLRRWYWDLAPARRR